MDEPIQTSLAISTGVDSRTSKNQLNRLFQGARAQSSNLSHSAALQKCHLYPLLYQEQLLYGGTPFLNHHLNSYRIHKPREQQWNLTQTLSSEREIRRHGQGRLLDQLSVGGADRLQELELSVD